MSIDSAYADATEYFSFDFGMWDELRTYMLKREKHYPHRVPPDKWPELKLIGKAMVKGWAVSCRYYPRVRGRGKPCYSYVFPGITDSEMVMVHMIMGGCLNGF